MNTTQRIEVNVGEGIDAAIYATMGEWSVPIEKLQEVEGEDLRAFFGDAKKVEEFLRPHLLAHWASLKPVWQVNLRRSLQFVLNNDEHVPYVSYEIAYPSSPYPYGRTAVKFGSIAQRMNSCNQDTWSINDGYEQCLMMWRILFGEEDWHADVSGWVEIHGVPSIHQKT